MADEEGREQRSRARQIGILTAIPAVLLAGPLVGLLLGKLVDSHFGTRPWGLLACLVLGFVAAFREVLRLIRLAAQSDEPPPTKGRRGSSGEDGKANR